MVTALKSGIDDPAIQGLPVANTRTPGELYTAEDFITIRNVPVFAEHETTNTGGRHLRFGASELQSIADRCNRRIAETGDYAALTLGHTPSPEQTARGKAMPDLVGFAGPFKLGEIGQENERSRYAVLADFHVFKEDMARVKKHPRRSPELWLEDSFEDMFLDPIALLGAELPRLDMGILYSAIRHRGEQSLQIEKYAAVAPAGPSPESVYPPSDELRRRYQSPDLNDQATQGATQMLSPEDVDQLVQAIENTDVFQWVKAQMSKEAGGPGSVPMADPQMGSPPEPGGMAAPAAPAMPAIMGGENGHDPAKQYGANATGEYQDAADTPEGRSQDHVVGDPLHQGNSANGSSPDKYAALDEMEDDELEKYMAQRSHRKKYGANGSADADSEKLPTNPSVEPDKLKPAAGSVDHSDYSATGNAMKFSRLQAEVARQRQEIDAANAKLLDAETKRVNAERYSVLFGLRQGFTFDLDTELDRCKYGRMTADQFTDHSQHIIPNNYKPMPLNGNVPTFDNATQLAPDRPGKVEKYSAEHSTRAFSICEQAAVEGTQLDYESVLNDVVAGKR